MSTATRSKGFILKAGPGRGPGDGPRGWRTTSCCWASPCLDQSTQRTWSCEVDRKRAMCKQRPPSPPPYTHPSTVPPSICARAGHVVPRGASSPQGFRVSAPHAAVQTFYFFCSLPGGLVLRRGEDKGVLAAGRPMDSSEDPAAGAAQFRF